MLKFKNLKWLFNKTTTIASILMLLVIIFSVHMNYQTIYAKLDNNNQIVAANIEGTLEKYKSRLRLIRELLRQQNLKDINLSEFTSVYYLDERGNVINKKTVDKQDSIDRFIEINSENIDKNIVYVSQLMYSKSLKPSVYLAIRLHKDAKENLAKSINQKPEFICVRILLKNFLHSIHSNTSDYLITDSHQNVLYSSHPEIVQSGISVGNINNIFSFDGIFNSDSIFLAEPTNIGTGFYVRSFISKIEIFNSYYAITTLLIAIFLLFIYSAYLDRKMLKLGIIDQLNYCSDIFGAKNLSDFQHSEALINCDLGDFKKQVAKSIVDYKQIRDEYTELEQRLSTMFSKSSIPMLMIDAFTAKIFKANQAALEFYNQKTVSITKMNLYMLGAGGDKLINDPIVLAENIQNCIKNQGSYIQAHHFVDGTHKEVKIYPFVMRSERFCYDTLMILDTNVLSKNFEYLNIRSRAIENSFICYLNLVLDNNKMIITSGSKGLQRYLGNISLAGKLLKSIVHPSSIPQLANVMRKVKELKQSGNIQQFKTYETALFLRQSDDAYSEFKVNFIIAFAKGLQIVLSAHLAHIRSDLSYFEVQTPIDYQNIFQSAKEHIAVLDENFNFLSVNSAVKDFIGNRTNLKEMISKSSLQVLEDIKNGIKRASYAELIDANGHIRKCKFKYLTCKNIKGDVNYCLYFQDDFYKPLIEELALFMKAKNIANEDLLCEFYENYEQITPIMAQTGLHALANDEELNKLKNLLTNSLKTDSN